MKKNPKHKETGLNKSYVAGLSTSTAKARKAHWAKTSKMDPKNQAAYEPAPGDATAKTKLSKHTKAYRAKFGEEVELDEAAAAGLAKKAKESGVSLGILRKVYNRGVAAWRTGHRPGTTPQQWGMARVNSYITKGKGTYHGADKDLRESLWANIYAKRKRGERMRKPGSKGAPTDADFKSARNEDVTLKFYSIQEELHPDYKLLKTGKKSTIAHPDGKPTYDVHHKGEKVAELAPYSAYKDTKIPGKRYVASRKDVTKYAIQSNADGLQFNSRNRYHNNSKDAAEYFIQQHQLSLKKESVTEAVDPNLPKNRLIGTDSLTKIYTKATPGQVIKRVVRECRCMEMDEAEYQGRKVPLGKPMKGDVKKSKVYVKNEKGNVVKVEFGDPNMTIKKHIPGRRKNFRARHNCDTPGPRTKARYWSCRAW